MNRRPNLLRALGLLWSVSPAHLVGVIAMTVCFAVTPALNVHLTALAVSGVAEAIAAHTPDGLEHALLVGVLLAGVGLAAHLISVWRDYP